MKYNDFNFSRFLPQPPIQVLNEMVGAGNVLSNTLPPSKDGFRMTTVEINVEVVERKWRKLYFCKSQGKTFTGIGPTPSIAKNIAAEAAVHHIATIMSSDPTEEEVQTGRAFEDRFTRFHICMSIKGGRS